MELWRGITHCFRKSSCEKFSNTSNNSLAIGVVYIKIWVVWRVEFFNVVVSYGEVVARMIKANIDRSFKCRLVGYLRLRKGHLSVEIMLGLLCTGTRGQCKAGGAQWRDCRCLHRWVQTGTGDEGESRRGHGNGGHCRRRLCGGCVDVSKF